MLTPEEFHRYSRQILLPSFGEEGQQKLKKASVLVIGAGGLGAPVLQYLTAAGVGKIGIIDFDKIDVSNLQRQVLFSVDEIGKSKATIAAERLTKLNPLIEIKTFTEPISSTNAKGIISDFDIVVDGTDNLPTRYLVNDACVFLNKALIYGAIFQYEGQVSVFNEMLQGETRGPNYRDLFPEPPPPEMVPSCSEGGVLGVLPGIIGSMMANEAIKVLTGVGETLTGRLVLFNSYDFTTRTVKIKRSPTNPLTGERPTLFDLIDYEQFCNPSKSKEIVNEIEPIQLKEWMDSGKEILLIDVRELPEVNLIKLESEHIPLKEIGKKHQSIPKDKPVIIYCKSGVRSARAIQQLNLIGNYHNLLNLKGGIIKWIDDIDPSLPRY